MSTYKRGRYWHFKFKFAGQVIRESSKSTSRTVARGAERARRRELEESWGRIERRSLPPILSIAAGRWLETKLPHIAPKTAELYRLALSHLKPTFGGRLLCDIAADDIARYQARRSAAGAAGRTVNLDVGVLRAILKKHKLWSRISDDVHLVKERRDVGRALMPSEEARLLQEAGKRQYSDSSLYTVAVLALNTAMGSQEIRTLRWERVDLGGRTVTVGKSKTEARTGRVIPLNQAAWAVLAHWRGRFQEAAPGHFVFPACENHKLDPSRPVKSFRTAWRNATRAAGLKGLRFHDLRHTAITKLAETLTSEQTIMAIAGHVSRRMLEHYSHVRLEAKRRALDAIAAPEPAAEGAQKGAQSQIQSEGVHPN